MSEDIHPVGIEFERLGRTERVDRNRASDAAVLACTSCWIREVAGGRGIFKRRGSSERDAAKARTFFRSTRLCALSPPVEDCPKTLARNSTDQALYNQLLTNEAYYPLGASLASES